jgi:hypothetical protein
LIAAESGVLHDASQNDKMQTVDRMAFLRELTVSKCAMQVEPGFWIAAVEMSSVLHE